MLQKSLFAVRPPLFGAVALWACAACGEDPPPPQSTPVDEGEDADGDGYGSVVDCDDTDPMVFPDQPEACDGVDTDCDPETAEAGVATAYRSGLAQDLTPLLSVGTVTAPAEYAVGQGVQEVRFCEGVWFVALDISSDVDVRGQAGADVVLSGGPDRSPVAIQGDGLSVVLDSVEISRSTGSSAHVTGTEYDGFAVGGGVFCAGRDTTVSLENVTLWMNEADYGGGLFSMGCDVDVRDSVVDTNVAVENGGGLLVVPMPEPETEDGESEDELPEPLVPTVTLSNVEVVDNAALLGAGVYLSGVSATVEDSVFSANVGGAGGGMYVAESPLSIAGGDFVANVSSGGGGALEIHGSAAEVVDSSFTENRAYYGGGAISTSGDLAVSGVTFDANSSDTWGGAVEADAGFEAIDTVFSHNTAGYDGGAIETGGDSRLTLSGVEFSLNSARSDGGGIHMYWGARGTGEACNFRGNAGGDIYSEASGELYMRDETGFQCTSRGCQATE